MADAQGGQDAANAANAANELAQGVEQLAIAQQKNALVKAQTYSGLPTDPSKQQMLISWGITLGASNTPRDRWAVTAATFMSPNMQQLMFPDAAALAALNSMTWERFSELFLAMSAGPAISTNLQALQAASNNKFDKARPINTSDAVIKQEALFNAMPSKPCDPTKIHLVIQAIHPALRSRVSYTTEGKDWPTYNAFRQHLLAQAAVFEAQQLPAPAPAPQHQQQHRGYRGPQRHTPQRQPHRHQPYGPKKPEFKKQYHKGRSGQPSAEVTCFKCHQKGHKAPDCPQRMS